MTALDEFVEIQALEDGWNGDGSLAPTRPVLDNAMQFVALWYPDADVTPMDNGTVMFEWPGWNLEVGQTSFALITPNAFINGTVTPR